jgi:diguanylate cyclase (GGDEF)-like protein
MIKLTPEEHSLAQQGVAAVDRRISEVINDLQNSVGPLQSFPVRLKDFSDDFQSLRSTLDVLQRSDPPHRLAAEHAPMLRTVIQCRRREKAIQVEQFRVNATDSEVIAALDAQLVPFQKITEAAWYIGATPLRIPQLADFLTRQKLAELRGNPLIPTPTFEDKFRILYAPSMLLPELARFRDECSSRDLPVSVVFLDIDNFKPLNTKYGETRVDADLLPVFMRLVERTVFGHGQAYRHGGDEIALIMPNSTAKLAVALLNQLRDSLASAPYAGIPERPTISCGICVLDPDSSLTDREALERTARAKKFAKESGRNSIASYSTSLCRDEDLILLVAL